MASAEERTPLNGANKIMKKWTNERLITATIGHIPRFSEEIMAKDLDRLKLWTHVIGLSVSGNRRIMELEMDDLQTTRILLDGGLNTHGRTLQFREATTDRVTVSLLGVPLGFPDLEIKDVLNGYGTIDRLYRLTKTIHGRTLQTGTVIIKFTQLDEPIPKNIDVADRRIRTIYTGQERHIAQWQQLKAQQTEADETRRQPDRDTTDVHATDSTPTNDNRLQTDLTSDTHEQLDRSMTAATRTEQASTDDQRQTAPPTPETAGVQNIDQENAPGNLSWYEPPAEEMETATTSSRKRTKHQAHLSDAEQSGATDIQPLVKKANEINPVVLNEDCICR